MDCLNRGDRLKPRGMERRIHVCNRIELGCNSLMMIMIMIVNGMDKNCMAAVRFHLKPIAIDGEWPRL